MASSYICQQCSFTSPKWSGKCSECGSWNSIIEQEVVDNAFGKNPISEILADKTKFNEVSDQQNKLTRYKSGIDDIDELLGGGIVAGSVVMLAGEPGIGKSTLLMQILGQLDKQDLSVLYVSGEESKAQVKDRADRLGVNPKKASLSASQSTEAIAGSILKDKPKICVVDSVQTVKVDRLISAPGTVSQVTNSVHILSSAAKQSNTTLVLVGQVTKEGSIAGPKLLEHLVDVVLYLSGERHESIRVLRSTKNRFGSTDHSALLSMAEKGLVTAESLSAELIAQKSETDGSVVAAVIEGNQPLLVEVQALVNDSEYGYPKRSSFGMEQNRLNILIAVLSRRTKLKLDSKDIYVNVAGGLKIKDPGMDLAICLAIASAATGRKLDSQTTVFGEVGLGGEIRNTKYSEKRYKEANRFKMKTVIGPRMKGVSKNYQPASDLRSVLLQYLKA